MIVTDFLNYYSGGSLFQEKVYTSGETLIKELSQYSSCKPTIEEALNVIQKFGLPALEVRFEPTKAGFEGERDVNVIRIRPGLSAAKQRERFMFELTNLIQHEEHNRTWESAVKGVYKNEEEYARAMEFLEFNGVKRRNIVSKAINKEKGRVFRPYFENEWERDPIESMEFDCYYSSYLPDSHKEWYRKEWRNLNNIQNTTTDIQNTTTSIQNTTTGIFNNILKVAQEVSIMAIVIFVSSIATVFLVKVVGGYDSIF